MLRGAQHRPGRPLRRLVRVVRGAGVRASLSATGCGRWCSTAPISCPAPTRRWPTSPPSTRSSLRLACGRRPGCPAGARPGDGCRSGWSRRCADTRSSAPRPTATARRTHVRVDEDALVQVLMSGFYYQGVWRDILAAARSARPATTPRSSGSWPRPSPPTGRTATRASSRSRSTWRSSAMTIPSSGRPSTPISERPAECARPSRRTAAGARSRRSRRRRGRAPTTRARWRAAVAVAGVARSARAAACAATRDVPTLILNGDLDNITPLSDAPGRRPPLPAKHARRRVENTGHVTALLDQNDCASVIYEHFVSTLSAGRHVLCAPHARGAGGAPVPFARSAPWSLRRAPGGATTRRCSTGGWPRRRPSHRRRRPRSAGGSTTTARGRPARRQLVVRPAAPTPSFTSQHPAGAGRGGHRAGRLDPCPPGR